jgi:hypothetical protein
LREKNNDERDEKVKHTPAQAAAAGVLLPGATSFSTEANVAAPLGVGVGGVHVASPIMIDPSQTVAPPATKEQEMATAAAKVVAATAAPVAGGGQKENEGETAKPPAAQQADAVAEEDQEKTQVVQGNDVEQPVESEQAAVAEVLEIPEPTKIGTEHGEASAKTQQEIQEADPTEDNEPTAEEIQEALQPNDDED